jgi:hypothetical protein
MKKLSRFIAVGTLVSLTLAAAAFSRIHAQDAALSQAQILRIQANCVSAKNTLQQLRASDGLLRVNRGQAYLSISTKLMSRFNDRASSNHLDITGLQSVSQNYDAMTATFSADYNTYAEQLTTAINIDCQKQPEAFYSAVELARIQRAKVHVDVTKLHQYIDDYDTVFNVFVNTEVTGK